METVVYHKYPKNRRIYDITNRDYSTLADIAKQLFSGNEVIVYLHPGKRKMEAGVPWVDITNQILLQILLEEEIKESFLSRDVLLALLEKPQTRTTQSVGATRSHIPPARTRNGS